MNHYNRQSQRSRAISNLRRRRLSNGTVLAEGAAGVVVLSAVIVPMLIFFANMAAQLVLQEKVSNIANQAAQSVDEQRYWIGLPRPGFNQSVASDKATAVAEALCRRVGLQNASVSVSFDDSNPDYDLTVCDVNVNAVSDIPFRTVLFGFDMASLFPGNVRARGVASHAKIVPYALIHMDAPHAIDQSTRRPLGFNERDVAVIPCYGFFYTAVAGETKVGTPYGKGLAPGLSPENFFAMNHYHLKKSDVTHVMATGEDIQLSGWHKQHVINGREIHY